ncbi:hypothetical protein BGW41_001953 [Actinomortierella wolfii]|nr:hypothetical protein BGW41_001953 [Actinomortierella wolfii]
MPSSLSQYAPTMLILDELPSSSMAILQEAGLQLDFLDAHKASYAEIQLRMSFCNLIAIRTRRTAEIISYLLSYWPTSRLHAIACFEPGVASALTINHIPVFSVSSTPSPYAVSELCLSLTIVLARRLIPTNRQTHAGDWQKNHRHCHEVRNKTMGIIGYESQRHIGHQTSILAQSLGMRVLAHTPRLHLLTYGRTSTSKDLDTVAQQSDFLVVLDDADLVERPPSPKLREALHGQFVIHASIDDHDGARTRRFLNWLGDAVQRTGVKDQCPQQLEGDTTTATAEGQTQQQQKQQRPIELLGVAIVLPTVDFDEASSVIGTNEQPVGQDAYDTADEGYATEDFACFKTGQYGRGNIADLKKRAAWRDQLQRLGTSNIVLIPQFALNSYESLKESSDKFAKQIAELSKEAMAQRQHMVDSTVPHYHSARPAHIQPMAAVY